MKTLKAGHARASSLFVFINHNVMGKVEMRGGVSVNYILYLMPCESESFNIIDSISGDYKRKTEADCSASVVECGW